MKIKLFSIFTVGLLILWQQQAMATDDCYYHVVNVQNNDMLLIRFGPDVKYQLVGAIPHSGTTIQITAPEIKIEKSYWVPIKYKGVEGWVNRGYLDENCQLSTQTINNPVYHIVEHGDTLSSISHCYGVSVQEIAQWNQLQQPYNVLVGQHLRVSPYGNCSFRVVKVPNNDMLWIRSQPSMKFQRIGAIPYNGTGIQITGPETKVGKSHWMPIKYKEIEGWVNSGYLEEDC